VRFKITEEHVIAALLDPTQKKLALIENHSNGISRKSLLLAKLTEYKLDTIENIDDSVMVDKVKTFLFDSFH
jgi:regulatory protein YycH of two-component signal transduction system YycFG